MKFQIDHDYHIHTHLSSCSADPDQTVDRLIRYGKQYGLKTLCVTDHCWDEAVSGASDWYAPQSVAHVRKALSEIGGNEAVKFGCETEMRADGVIGLSKQAYDGFDFVIIPTTHLHMDDFTIATGASVQERQTAYVERFRRLLNEELPFGKIGIPHLATALIGTSENAWQRVLDGISDKTYCDLFEQAAAKGVGIELNSADFAYEKRSKEEAASKLRVFLLAKKCGCKFYLGSDAHHPQGLDGAIARFATAVELLGLTEADKFYPHW